MASRLIAGYGLYHALKEEGYELPPECGDVEMLLPVDGVIRLAFIVNMTEEHLAQFGRALIRLAEKGGEVRPYHSAFEKEGK